MHLAKQNNSGTIFHYRWYMQNHITKPIHREYKVTFSCVQCL